jgi:excisionase family DNA binding protein
MAVKKFFNGTLEIMDVETLAKQLDIHKVTLLRKIRQKKLYAQRIGRSYWVSKDSLKAFLDDGLAKGQFAKKTA